MCFGSKNDAGDADAPRPAQGQQSYAPEPKRASVPPQYHQQQQQQQQQPQPQQQYQQQQYQQQPVNHEYAPPSGPPPSHQPPQVSSGRDEFAPPPGPPPSQRPVGNEYAPPSGPPPGHRVDDYAPPAGPPPGSRHDDYAPPSGPPPGQRHDDYAPPSGPPPSQRHDDYAPPAGPPPGQRHDDYAPPSGPPPSHRPHDDLSYVQPPPGPPPADNKPKHEWETLVPDTSLFPPPPSFFSGFDRSPANNATEAEAEAGEAWCAQHPLTAPITLDAPAAAALAAHNPRLMQPDGFRGSLTYSAPGLWTGHTTRDACDSTIIAYPPLYAVTLHSPLAPHNAQAGGFKTIYYEVQLTSARNRPQGDICVALGFTALPYPSFRMPGWHRGSLAVHGDDGHKFINDRWGGKAFTEPFVRGDRYGVGMTFRAVHGRIEVEVFFTRQGGEVGRWNLHEETDAQQDLPVTGLEGYHDLSCAVGTSGETGWEVVLDPKRWLYRPVGY